MSDDRYDQHSDSARESRRDLLRLAGAAAAGVVAGAVVAEAPSAEANTNSALLLGQGQSVDQMTFLINGGPISNGPGNSLSTEATMFWVDNRNSTIDGNGLRADGHANGVGLWGNNDYTGAGVLATGALGLRAAGRTAAMLLTSANPAPAARSDAHVRGEIDTDTAGNVWLCVAAGTPGTWRKIAGPASAGAFHAINSVRAYDSRSGGSRLSAGGQRLVSLASKVPAGTTAVACNVTVTSTKKSGSLTVAAGSASHVSGVSVSWWGNRQTLTAGSISGVDSSRRVRVFAHGRGSAHFAIDIVGYFL
jgi:hypothetical protein